MESFKELDFVTTASTKRYHNCFSKLLQLTYCDRYLLDYLAEIADDDNRVFLSKPHREDFIIFIKKMSKGDIFYSDNTVRNSVMKLKELELILPIPKQEARYWINPLHFCKWRHTKRNNLVEYVGRQLEEAV